MRLSVEGWLPGRPALSPGGHILATVSSSNELTFWDTDTWNGRRVFGAPLAVVRALAFSADGKTLAVATDQSAEAESKAFGDFPAAPNVRIPVQKGSTTRLAAPNQWHDYVPWQNSADSLRFWDLESGEEQTLLKSLPTLTMASRVVWSHIRNTLAAATRDGRLWAWDMGRREIVANLCLDDETRLH